MIVASLGLLGEVKAEKYDLKLNIVKRRGRVGVGSTPGQPGFKLNGTYNHKARATVWEVVSIETTGMASKAGIKKRDKFIQVIIGNDHGDNERLNSNGEKWRELQIERIKRNSDSKWFYTLRFLQRKDASTKISRLRHAAKQSHLLFWFDIALFKGCCLIFKLSL